MLKFRGTAALAATLPTRAARRLITLGIREGLLELPQVSRRQLLSGPSINAGL